MTVAEYNYCVDEFADSIFRFILKNIGDAETAKDIVQDTFEKMWIKHENVEFSKGRSYLFTSAYHTLVDHTRREKRWNDFQSIQNQKDQTLNNSFTDLKQHLDWALNQISEDQRSVILLRDYEGYSYEEIGQITGLTPNQVKVYIYRGRLALRKLIGNPEVLI